MLICYLRVCPYVRPLGDKCIIEKVPGECCPRITCPSGKFSHEWISNLCNLYLEMKEPEPEPEPEPTTQEPEVGEGCYVDGEYYREGSHIPSNPEKPCEVCYCIRNSSSCVVQECTLGVSGCSPVYSSKTCCPTRYNCCEYIGIFIRLSSIIWKSIRNNY